MAIELKPPMATTDMMRATLFIFALQMLFFGHFV
jgi:hypothetical protein